MFQFLAFIRFSPLAGILALLLSLAGTHAGAQPCSGAPSFTIDLSGKADSTWTSSSVIRAGECCGSSFPDRCIEFNLTLDSGSNGIRFDIASGAIPSGALYYQIGCGGIYQVGEEICLSGPGPHRITFCKPGNNINTYQIKAIPKPAVEGKLVINEACIGFLKAYGLVDTSITWQSVPNSSTHNGYLSCTEDCDSVSIIPTGNFPPTVTYRVCGRIIGGCGGAMFCDTATVRFVTNIDVEILPKNPTVCFGGSTTSISANPVGGLAPFRYTWNTGDTTSTLDVDTGLYHVTMTDSLGCTIARDTVVVTGFSLPIAANAGNDTSICTRRNFVLLHGSIDAASGGRWVNGSGTFVPDDSLLQTTYFPSAAETLAGQVILRLITTGNGTCPADTDEVTVTLKPGPIPAISGPDTVCSLKQTTYQTNGIAGASFLWQVTGGQIAGDSTDTIVHVTWFAVDSGLVQLYVSQSNGCDSTQTLQVNIISTPVPVITGPDTVCRFDQSVYQCSPSTSTQIEWSVSGGIILGDSTDSVLIVKWNNAGNGLVSLKLTRAGSCDSTVQYAILINPTPVPVIYGDDTACTGKNTVYFTHSSNPVLNLWTVSGGYISGSTTDTAVHIVWDSAGTQQVQLTLTHPAGCDSSMTKSVNIKPTYVPQITGDTLVCALKSNLYRALYRIGHTYQWQTSGGTILGSSSDTLVQIYWPDSGSGIIRLTETTASGCDSTVQQFVTINPTPAPVIEGDDTTCAFQNTTYTARFSNGYNCTWTVNGGTPAGSVHDSMLTVIWGTAGNGSVSLMLSHDSGCDSTITMPVTIHPSPVPQITGDTLVCAYKQITYLSPVHPGNIKHWSVSGGHIQGSVNGNSIVVIWNVSGTGTIRLTETNVQGCDSTVELSVVVKPAPTATATGPVSVCANKNTLYYSRSIPGCLYAWSVIGGTMFQLNDTLIRVNWGIAGLGIVRLQISYQGCDSITELNVVIRSTPVPIILGPQQICAHTSQTYQVATYSAGHQYTWSVAGGQIIQTSGNGGQITVNWGDANNGVITLQETNSFGCDSTTTYPVVIKPSPIPQITGLTVGCTGTVLYDYHATPSGNYTYLWNIQNGELYPSNGVPDIQVRWLQHGIKVISVRITDNNSLCDTLHNISVQVDSTIKPDIKASTFSGCIPLIINFTGGPGFAGYNYLWEFGDGYSSSHINPTHLFQTAGNFMIKLKVVSQNGCADSTDSQVRTSMKPVADFIFQPQQQTIYANEDTVSFQNQSIGGNRYRWVFGDGKESDTYHAIMVYDKPGKYNTTLYVVDTVTGCENLIVKKLEVKVREILYAPNAFTPNHDGINDYFSVSVTNIVDFRIIIFDRWGKILYESRDPYFAWNGTYQSEPVQCDAYGYLVEGRGVNGTLFTQTGTVTLLR